jgi:hypothetical protein
VATICLYFVHSGKCSSYVSITNCAACLSCAIAAPAGCGVPAAAVFEWPQASHAGFRHPAAVYLAGSGAKSDCYGSPGCGHGKLASVRLAVSAPPGDHHCTVQARCCCHDAACLSTTGNFLHATERCGSGPASQGVLPCEAPCNVRARVQKLSVQTACLCWGSGHSTRSHVCPLRLP